MNIHLGDVVRDNITGFSGTVTAKTVYIHREPLYLVECVDTTNRPIEWWCEESRLIVI